MKTYVGSGKGNAAQALEAATSGLSSPNMILFIAPYQNMAETAKILKEKYPKTQSIGTIGISLANGKVSDSSTVVLGFFGDAVVKCGIIKELDSCPVSYIDKLQEDMNSVSPGRDDTVCIEYCTNDEETLVSTMSTALAKKNVPLVGGTTYGAPNGKPGIVAYNGNIYENSCAYAFIKNTTGRVLVYKENIYEKNENISHFATKVNTAEKSLIELDGKSAADVYSHEIGINKDQIVGNVLKNPIGRIVGDEVFISSMYDMKGRGELINYKQINRNDCIYILKLGDYRQIEEDTRRKIKSDAKSISLVLSVDCIYRYLLYSQEAFIDEYAKAMSTLGNHVGAVGGGEQFINQHVNQTLVCAVFE